jgi:hypothetical protein
VTEPINTIEAPDWQALSAALRLDFNERNAGQETWDQWNQNQRLEALNTRAVLVSCGAWSHIRTICFGDLACQRRRAHYSPALHGWALGLLPSGDVRHLLISAGFRLESTRWNHPEGRWSLKQSGPGYVLHVIALQPPSDEFLVSHFDSGGGSLFSMSHISDWWHNRGVRHDEVARYLSRTAAGEHLHGLSG